MGNPGLKVIRPETNSDNDTEVQGTMTTQAIVPTIDIYTARFLFNITQKMVEDTVDRRISVMEKNIESRDQELMRNIRKLQARLIVQQHRTKLPWWRRLFAQD